MKSTRSGKACRRSAIKAITASNKKNAADTGLSPSKRHREKLNMVMDELCDLLPLSTEVKTRLDRLSVLKLTVSFFQTQNLTISAKQSKQCKPISSKEGRTTVTVEGFTLSELALQAIGGFFVVLTEDGVVYYISENVQSYLGYSQTRLIHQDFFPHVHPDDLQGLKYCFSNLKSLSAKNSTINTAIGVHQECFCNIRCHAGRLSSHVSPFYYKCFKIYGHLRPLKSKATHRSSTYGFFALCSPVDRQVDVFRPLSNNVEKYTCRMDAAFQNIEIDTRGLKFLELGEKDLLGRSSYCFFHPEDLSGMALAHEKLLADNKVCMSFRVLKGNNIWQWVRGKAYPIINKGKVLGMVSKNFFISDEEGEYFKEQDIKDVQEWKACQSHALPFSQGSSYNETSSPSSGSMSPVGELLHSIPCSHAELPGRGHDVLYGPSISAPSRMEAPPAHDDLSRQYAHPLPLLHKPKAKSSCLVNDDPMSFNDVVMDNDTMLKIIKDLQNSLIDGSNGRAWQYPPQPLHEVDLFSGESFSESLQHTLLPNTGLPFLDPSTNIKPANGQDIVFGQGFSNHYEQDKHFNDMDRRHLDTSNGLNFPNEKLVFHNHKPNYRVNDMKGSCEGVPSVVHMDEQTFADFVPLPLVEVENILSNDKSTYTMTSPYDILPLQPSTMDITQPERLSFQ